MKKTTLTIAVFLGTLILLQGCTDLEVNGEPVNYTNQTQTTDNYTTEPIEPPKPPSVNGTQIEKLTHELVNQEREKYGLSTLKWNGELASVARKHSKYLANRSENHGFDSNQSIYISHVGRDGEKHSHRIEKAEIYYTNGSAENVAGVGSVNTTYVETGEPASYRNSTEITQQSVRGWMNSTGHRENILTPQYEETGIGVATDPTNTTYIFTQVFINRADCGYRYGECCSNGGCFTGLECTEGKCIKETSE